MVEYGGTISHGGAGQVSGGGGGGGSIVAGHPQSIDVGSSLSGFFNDATHTFSTLPLAGQVLIVVAGLFVLWLIARRAF
jgi:hypothetical protein